MDIKKIVNTVLFSNTYVIIPDNSECVSVIDPGDFGPLKDYLLTNKKQVSEVLLTHTHYDHIYGLNTLLDLVGTVPIYTSSWGALALYSDKLNMSRYHNLSFILSKGYVVVVEENDCLQICSGRLSVNVIETPGHDPSCLSYCVGRNIFTGDSYIPGYNVVTTFPNSSKEDAAISLEKIMRYTNCVYYPGHL